MKNEMNENVNELVEETAAPETAQPVMLDLPTAVNTVIARTEATSIVVAAINAFLDVIQKKEAVAFTHEELNRIQAAINAETNKTDALYHEIEKALAQNAPAEEATSPSEANPAE